MPEASNSVVIDRPVADVFVFLGNAENDRRWRSGVVELQRVSGEGVGTRYHQVVSGPGGRKVNADIEIIEFTPNSRIAFRTTTGPVRPEGSYDLSPQDGGTKVTFKLSATVGGLKSLFMGSMVQKTMNNEVAALSELKRVLESSTL
ncbi:MAG: SRPBCC family protein [Candidatus Dormibacteria bacterium]